MFDDWYKVKSPSARQKTPLQTRSLQEAENYAKRSAKKYGVSVSVRSGDKTVCVYDKHGKKI